MAMITMTAPGSAEGKYIKNAKNIEDCQLELKELLSQVQVIIDHQAELQADQWVE